ncbi:unnamed protein product [Durusdinium trenchii]|uniref:Uncharacterized protein n=2 Tax=Durusdinium trenchii TaxID=1381693 RepID=A0ABP0LS28_9DINO
MPRHSNSFACGLDVPELAVSKRVRPGANGTNKWQKHPGKTPALASLVDLDEVFHAEEEEDWSEPETSVETTATAREQSTAQEEEDDQWDLVSQAVPKEQEWPSLDQSRDPELLDYDLFETMSQVSDLTLSSWVDLNEDLEESKPATWASRIGPSNGLPKPKTALPWAGKLRPTPENATCSHEEEDPNSMEFEGRTWNKWQKSSRNLKAVERRLVQTARRQEQRLAGRG